MRIFGTALSIAALVGMSTQQYNTDLGWTSFYYSAAAYCAYETLDGWDCGLPC